MRQIPDITNEAERARLSPAATEGFFNIMKRWRVSDEDAQRLLGIPHHLFVAIRQGSVTPLDEDTLTRTSYIIGIYKALRILLPDEAIADSWIKEPNDAPMFEGRAALDFMLEGGRAALHKVRQYLHSELQGWN